MKVKEKKWIRFRIHLVAVFFMTGLAAVFARAYQLQILERDYLKDIADNGITGITKLPPERGTIYDREGNELALSVQVASIFAHPKLIKNKEETAKRLSGILKMKKSNVRRILNDKRSFVWIQRRISSRLGSRVKTAGLEGIGVTTETRRYYPGKEIAAHLIGFSGTDNQGLEGLEQKYDTFLRGPQQRLVRMRDALGRSFDMKTPIPSGQGMHHLVLTIDKQIQYKAQQALKSAVKTSKAKSGQCLIVNPETGEILALAVVPEFNPNIFSKYSANHWRNRVVTDCFEPGSTIKAFLASACLEKAVVTPTSMFDCEGGKYKIGGRIVHDTHEYEELSMADIIVHSSNIGAIKLGEKLGHKTFVSYLKKFGFGEKTGIGLSGERSGFIRDSKETKKIGKATLCFGQGMTATSLQLAMAMSAIANGGKLMQPYVVKKVMDRAGNTVMENSPKVVRRVISEKTARKVSSILENVTGADGTAPRAAISGFRVAGKTGTSQKVDQKTKRYSKRKYVASFVGFAPAEKPRMVIMVAIDEPKGLYYGGVVAGPVFKEVGLWTLNHLGVNPQADLSGVADAKTKPIKLLSKNIKPLKENREKKSAKTDLNPLEKGLLPDFRGMGMREVLKQSRGLGLKVSLKGSGLAMEQKPAAGSLINQAKRLVVSFEPPT